MKYITLSNEELNSIAYYKEVMHISGEVSVHLIHDVINSYLKNDLIIVNYKEKRKSKYRYIIYDNNEANEEYLKYEFDLIEVDPSEKEALMSYFTMAKVLKR